MLHFASLILLFVWIIYCLFDNKVLYDINYAIIRFLLVFWDKIVLFLKIIDIMNIIYFHICSYESFSALICI